KAVFKTACVEIIKEDAADTTRFLAMLQIEIVVTPLFIVRVHIIAEGLQRVATGAVEMLHIFLEAVIGREVHAAAEPPDCFLVWCSGDEETYIHVHSGHIGIAWMQYQRYAHRFPFTTGKLGTIGCRGCRQRIACHMRKADAAALEHMAVLYDARNTSATFRAVPTVEQERRAIGLLQRCHNALLEILQILPDGGRGW